MGLRGIQRVHQFLRVAASDGSAGWVREPALGLRQAFREIFRDVYGVRRRRRLRTEDWDREQLGDGGEQESHRAVFAAAEVALEPDGPQNFHGRAMRGPAATLSDHDAGCVLVGRAKVAHAVQDVGDIGKRLRLFPGG
jgi:hypothetical protein